MLNLTNTRHEAIVAYLTENGRTARRSLINRNHPITSEDVITARCEGKIKKSPLQEGEQGEFYVIDEEYGN